ncbi:MAG: DNA polymerase III subunit gamma/tau [Bacteroidota bacterium]
MSQFVVSARKYRPQRFDEVVGQEHVSQTLKNALQNDQLAHAFLFCGPRGVGKTTCARILAKVLNCENRTEDFEACNECSSCQSFNSNSSFNINELDAASNNSVEHIRALIEQVRFQPQQGQYKIFIIDEVHMLSQQAFNAFLKTLEEPPSYAIFILATTEKHKIIPTILSRCQIFDFKRIQIPRMVEHLQQICAAEGIEADKDALHIIGQKADGALRDALSIFDRMTSFAGKKIDYESVIENLNVLDYDYYFRVVDAMLVEDTATVLLIFDTIFRKGFDPDIFINGLAEHLRNLLVCKDAKTIHLLETGDSLKERYAQQANLAPNSFILTALNMAAECDINYKMARHKRLHVEMAVIKMTYIGRAVEITQSPTANVGRVEKKTLDVSPIVPIVAAPKPSITNGRKPVALKPTQPTSNPTSKVVAPTPAVSNITESSVSLSEPTIVSEPEVALAVPPKVEPPKRKTTKYDMPSLGNLDDDEEEETSMGTSAQTSIVLDNELLDKTWNDYVATIDSPSVKAAFQKAEAKVKNESTIEVVVGSQMAKGMIQQEKKLIPFLRHRIPIADLAMEITIDSTKASQLIKPKKILTVKETYEMMREKNPMVHELRLRLDLKPDNQ